MKDFMHENLNNMGVPNTIKQKILSFFCLLHMENTYAS